MVRIPEVCEMKPEQESFNEEVILPFETSVELFVKREDVLHSEISGNKFRKLKYNLQEAIQYMKMADKCPSEILYDKEKFITYLTARDIPEAEAEKIRSGIIDFK